MGSDGIRAQFRAYFIFMLLSKFDLTKSLERHYNAVHYGTGPMDRVGGRVKKLVLSSEIRKELCKTIKRNCQSCEYTNTIDSIHLFINIRNVSGTTISS